MARQVSGSEKTLIQAIRDGDVERPTLMDWNTFQVWRSRNGRRPIVATDGFTTTTTQESALWKSVMADLYGENWTMILAQGGEEPRETGTPPPPREPRLEPAAGAEVVTPGPALRESPGSGDLPPGAAESGPSSPVPSFDSQRPGTPAGLTAKVLKPFVPQKESLLKYQERVKKQAAALESLGEPLTEGVLDVLLQRAEFQDEIFEQGRTDVRKQIRALRRLYAVELVAYDGSEDDATKMAQSIRMQALEALLEAYGQSAREIGLLVAENVDEVCDLKYERRMLGA